MYLLRNMHYNWADRMVLVHRLAGIFLFGASMIEEMTKNKMQQKTYIDENSVGT